MPAAPVFFFSYARKDAEGGYLFRFFDDLRREVSPYFGVDTAEVGFIDREKIELGERWTDELAAALGSCGAFVAGYSPAYFASEACGKEWAAFRQRYHAQFPDAAEPPLVLPVCWVPPQAAWLPACATRTQYQAPGDPRPYREEGLRALLKYGDEKANAAAYGKVLRGLVKRLRSALRDHPLAPYPTVFDFGQLPNAFAAETAEVGARERELRGQLAGYLKDVWTELSPLSLLALADRGGDRPMPLAAVYTTLDVTAEVRFGGPEGALRGAPKGRRGGEPEVQIDLAGEAGYLERLAERARGEAARHNRRRREPGEPPAGEREAYHRRLGAVEAAAACPRLVLLGPPGSGKSTFARYLALCLAGQILGRQEANLALLNRDDDEADDEPAGLERWPHGPLVPIFVELRKLVASDAFPAEGEEGTHEHLFGNLGWRKPGGLSEAALGYLRERLDSEAPAAVLVLDGLDETPSAEQVRGRLCQVIDGFARRYTASCRVLLTSRPYAYRGDSPWRLDAAGFVETTLAPFTPAAIGRFVASWYEWLAFNQHQDAALAPRRAQILVAEIEAQPHLQPLAERPLLLTLMTHLHASSGGSFTGGRAALYERATDLLLDRWNQVRDASEAASVAARLGMSPVEMRRAAEELAFTVHGASGAGAEPAAIGAGEVWAALSHHRPAGRQVAYDDVMDYLHQRSGILLAESPQRYRFPHRSFQEYLAGCYLVEHDFPERLRDLVVADPGRWREVFLLAAARAARIPLAVWGLLKTLVPAGPRARVKATDPRFLHALLAGLAVRESALDERLQEAYRDDLEKIRRWLERAVALGALEPVERAAAGRVLAVLGDRRAGVGLRVDGVPEIDWVEVPAGEFLMGSQDSDEEAFSDERPAQRLVLPAFRISRHPVTNEQYRAFAADDGYGARRREHWTAAGWSWRERAGISGPLEDLPPDFQLANHPRVGVSWYEAFAFSRWLGGKLGHEVGLPSEAQWEEAARGSDGRVYPWGGPFDAATCNVFETGIGRSSAVGMFPGGASPCGALDMSGNVWEWCLTKWRRSYEQPADDDPEGTAGRVVRGGAFNNNKPRRGCPSGRRARSPLWPCRSPHPRRRAGSEARARGHPPIDRITPLTLDPSPTLQVGEGRPRPARARPISVLVADRCAYRNDNDPDNRNRNIGFRVVAHVFLPHHRQCPPATVAGPRGGSKNGAASP